MLLVVGAEAAVVGAAVLGAGLAASGRSPGFSQSGCAFQ